MAFVGHMSLIDHEITHVFGFDEVTIGNVINARTPFSSTQCELVRVAAQAIVDIPQ